MNPNDNSVQDADLFDDTMHDEALDGIEDSSARSCARCRMCYCCIDPDLLP